LALSGRTSISVFVWYFTSIHTSSEGLFLPVRPSTSFDRRFSLGMDRSRRFFVEPLQLTLFSNSLSLRLFVSDLPRCKDPLAGTFSKGTQLGIHAAKPHGVALLRLFRHTVSGSLSLPNLGFFSPFPHGTSALSVIRLYLRLG